MNNVYEKIMGSQTQAALLRVIGWGFGVPIGWWLVSTSYRLQQGWNETYFLVCYLLLYVMLSGLALLARTKRSELPGFTLWTLLVFSGVGIGRLVWLTIQWEHGTGFDLSVQATLLALVLGTISLALFLRWEFATDRKRKPATRVNPTRVLRLQQPAADGFTRDDMSWW